MKAILLAAGNSTRTWPILNKNFLNFNGEPLFVQLIKNAQKGGLNEFIIVGQKDNIQAYQDLLCAYDIQASFVIQKNLSQGMAGAILCALETLSLDEEVCVLGGNDLITPTAYEDLFKKSQAFDGGILAKKVEQYFPGGYLSIRDDGVITNIIEKPGEGNEPSSLVNIVAHYFKSAFLLKEKLNKYKSKQEDFYEMPVLQELFKEKKFKAVEYDNLWQAIKYPWHILDMMDCFLGNKNNSIDSSAQISPSATLKGDGIVISKNVRIFENTTIQGPCFIGKKTTIGNNCLIRNSMIGADCSIGFNSEIARSYLASNISTHYAYIGDSVVDDDVNFGAFSCTANLRLDKAFIKVKVKEDRINSQKQKLGAFIGRGAQIGIHAMLMPGTKIAPETFVAPGSVKN